MLSNPPKYFSTLKTHSKICKLLSGRLAYNDFVHNIEACKLFTYCNKKNSMLHDYMIMGKNEEREEACLIENRFLKFLFASHQVGGTSVLFRLWS